MIMSVYFLHSFFGFDGEKFINNDSNNNIKKKSPQRAQTSTKVNPDPDDL